MPDSPNKLSQFWQELKRRKVVRVITVYAAAAFVILELVEILAPSLRLPEWYLSIVIDLLYIGFIITVIHARYKDNPFVEFMIIAALEKRAKSDFFISTQK